MASGPAEASEESIDPYEERRFAAELELFQSWAAMHARRCRMAQLEWMAVFVALLLTYVALVATGLKSVTWLDVGAGLLLLGTAVGVVYYEEVCAASFLQMSGSEEDSGHSHGSGSSPARDADGDQATGGMPALGGFS